MAKNVTLTPAHKSGDGPAIPEGQMLVDKAKYTELLETVPTLIQQRKDAVAKATEYHDDLQTTVRVLAELGPVLGLSGGKVGPMDIMKIFQNVDKLKAQMQPLLSVVDKYTVPAETGA